MIQVREIVKGALKKLTVLAAGREPTAAQGEDGLEALQAIYREMMGGGVFGRLNDVLVQQPTYNARENDRVTCDYPTGVNVTLPETITTDLQCGLPGYNPWAGDYGRGGGCETLPRPPRDYSPIVVVDVNSTFEKYYLYDSGRAYWVLLDDLTLDTQAPLSNRHENGLKAKLALRLAPTFGRQVTPLLMGEVNAFHHAITRKADRSWRPTVAEYF